MALLGFSSYRLPLPEVLRSPNNLRPAIIGANTCCGEAKPSSDSGSISQSLCRPLSEGRCVAAG
jgi:hypothetical protein